MANRFAARLPRVASVAFVAGAMALGPLPARVAVPSAYASTPLPDSMASLGDSITRGFNGCGLFVDCPPRSWSTGFDPAVNSHYLRIRAENGSLEAYNNAQSGAKVAALEGQAETAVRQDVEYVTILIGANDACASSESAMTSVRTFKSQFRAAMGTLRDGLPDAAIFVSSIPDIKRLWFIAKDQVNARLAWSTFDICQSMLADPLSTDRADEARRDRVRQRVIDYNRALEQVCREDDNCKFDGNAVFKYRFTLRHVSVWDYFHPSTAGQAVLADVTYRKGFDW
ncbi:MAG: GDSL-type esterase/lipase family protein [Egibacteraceae bacterium]